MSNVVQHQTAIWADLKEWCDREQASAAQARGCWPEIASRMARLRRGFPSDPLFGAALEEHDISYSKDDRAAYIHLGKISAEALRDAMAMNSTRSVELLSRWVKARAKDDAYWSEVTFGSSEREDQTPPSPPAEAPVLPETKESAPVEISDQRETQQVDQKPAPLDKRIGLVQRLGEAEARALLAHYTDNVTRQMLAKVQKPALIDLAALVRTGRLGAKNSSNMNKFSARVLVPELPKEWTRARTVEPTETKAVKAIMADAERFIAMREAGCTTKAACDRWWSENVTRRKAIDVTTATMPQPNGSADAAPIIVHGRTIWPRPSYVSDADKYTRSAAVAMFHLWHDLDQELSRSEPSPVGRGRFILKIAMWIKQGINPHAGAMLQEMATAMQSDEQGALETSHLTFITGDSL
jgi:hypothetical protein